MKKILLFLTAILSINAIAADKGDYNFYTKFGLDVHSRFTAIKDEDGEIYGKKGKLGVNFALEATKNITPDFELGLGLAYTKRKSTNESFRDEDSDSTYKLSAKFPRYSSIPLYLVTKYNFNIDSDIKPYIKANLGYSFNKSKNLTLHVEETNKVTGAVTHVDEKTKLKAKNGLYAEFGVGAEYNNLLVELSYVHTSSKLDYTDEDGDKWKDKINNKSVRLSVGYKFNF